MSNRINGTDKVIDTFSEDVVLSVGRIEISKIYVYSDSLAARAVFVDAAGDVVAPIPCPAGEGVTLDCGRKFTGMVFRQGLTLKVSLSTLNVGDVILIWEA
jgi:hypothetical protein